MRALFSDIFPPLDLFLFERKGETSSIRYFTSQLGTVAGARLIRSQ